MPQDYMTAYEAARQRMLGRQQPQKSWWDTAKDFGGAAVESGEGIAKGLGDMFLTSQGNTPAAERTGEGMLQTVDDIKKKPSETGMILGEQATGIPFRQVSDELGRGDYAKAAGHSVLPMALLGLGAKYLHGGPGEAGVPEAPPPAAAPPAGPRALLPERTGPRFYAGDAGVADASTPYKRFTGNPNPMLQSGTPTLGDVGEVVPVSPELAAQGLSDRGGPAVSLGKQKTRAAQAAAEGIKAERARQPKSATPLSGRQQMTDTMQNLGDVEDVRQPGPARQSPGIPSVEKVTNQDIYNPSYPPTDPNVPGVQPVGDVSAIGTPAPAEVPQAPMRLPAGHQSALRAAGVPEEQIRSMTIPQANQALKTLKTTTTPGVGDVAPVGPSAQMPRLGPKKNIYGDNLPDPNQGPMAGPMAQVKADLKTGIANKRPYQSLNDGDLETLGIRGDATAIKESIGRKRGDLQQVPLGPAITPNPSSPRLSIAERLQDETGAVGTGVDAMMKERAATREKQDPIDFNAPVAGGNVFHGSVNPTFDKNFANWVNARNASKIEGIIKRREFSDLDTKGMQGITDFQNGLQSGRFKDVGDYFDTKHEQLQSTGVKLGFRENYLPQLWDNPSDQVFGVQKRLGLSPSFSLKRVLQNYKMGVDAGLTPKYKTIGQLMGWYEGRANKAIADRQFFDHLRESGQILPDSEAPPEWKTLNPDNFPVQKFQTAKGDHVTKLYKAPGNIASSINNYLGEGHPAGRAVANAGSITKNLVLSSGLPLPAYGGAADVHLSGIPGIGPHLPDAIGKIGLRGTALNMHGGNIAVRNVMANGILRGGPEAMKYLVNPRSAKGWLDASIASAPDAVKHGLTLTTEEHDMGTTGSTNLLPGQTTSKVGTVVNSALKKILSVHGKLFEDPLFQNVIPALKLKHYNDLAGDLVKQGMSEEAAKTAAAENMNALYGGINWESMQRSRDLQNLLRGIVLAPDWFESQYRIGKGMGKTMASPTDAQGLPYKRIAANLVGAYISANVLNYAINGKPMWENPPGRSLEIKVGKTGGKDRYIAPFGTAADFARLPFETIMGFKQGDLSGPTKILKNRFSTITRPGLDLIMNEDPYGNPIFGPDKYGNPQSRLKQLGSAGREVSGAVTPQYISGPINYATGRAGSAEEAVLGAVEAPVRYARESTKGMSRYRPARRRPSRQD